LATEQLNEGWWGHYDEFQLVQSGDGSNAAAALRVTPGPVPVPELVRDVEVPSTVAHGPVAGSPVTPAWWAVFDQPRFPQPASRGTTGGAPRPSARPLAVPELPLVPVTPWPPPVLAGDTRSIGWWMASDGRWYAPGTEATARTRMARGSTGGRPRKVLGALAAVAVVLAVVSVGSLVATGHRSRSGNVTPKTAGVAGGSGTAPSTAHSAAPPTTRPQAATPTTGATTPTTIKPTTTTAPVTSPQPQATSGVVYQYESATTATTVAQLAANPAAYAGRSVAFTAVIAAFVLDSSGGAMAMYVSEPATPTTVVLVQLSQSDDVTRINTGDTVVIWGDATGRVNYANTIGQPADVTNVNQVYLSDRTSGYQDTGDLAPA